MKNPYLVKRQTARVKPMTSVAHTQQPLRIHAHTHTLHAVLFAILELICIIY